MAERIDDGLRIVTLHEMSAVPNEALCSGAGQTEKLFLQFLPARLQRLPQRRWNDCRVEESNRGEHPQRQVSEAVDCTRLADARLKVDAFSSRSRIPRI